MRVLVTGGAGYLGSVLVPLFLQGGHYVTVLDNFMYGQRSLNHLCRQQQFNVIRGDARDSRVICDLVKNHDILVPLAALVGAPLCAFDPIGAVSTNVEAVRTLCLRAGLDHKIIIPISNSGYGIGEPGKECTEDSPLRPISLYGRTKVEAEKIALEHKNAVSLRLATLFGMSPRMRLDLLVNDFVWRAVNDRAIVLFEAGFKRNFLHVYDAARAFLHATNASVSGIYNVGMSDANLSKRELCDVIARHVPGFTVLESPTGEDPDKRDYIVSNAKIEATGWKPLFSLDQGVYELIRGYTMMKKVQHGNV
jgi:nucleoside-diphosphate-sugar epimerase